MGGPFRLGWNLGRLQLPSLDAAVVLVLGLYLYVPFGAARIPLSGKEPVCGQRAPRYCCFQGSPSTLRDTAIVFSSHNVGGS